MSDAQRGNTTHGPNLDEQLKQESRGMVQGHGAPHAEPFRETEPLPDDTDPREVQEAFAREDPEVGERDAANTGATEGESDDDEGADHADS